MIQGLSSPLCVLKHFRDEHVREHKIKILKKKKLTYLNSQRKERFRFDGKQIKRFTRI